MSTHAIPLPNSERPTIVDAADRDLVAGFRWRLVGPGYVGAWRGAMLIYLHRLIAGPGPHQRVDHRNGDPLDNRKSNLRVCTAGQNRANAGKNRTGRTSRYKGVSWQESRARWVAYITVDGHHRQLGRYKDEDEAAVAYDRAAAEAWGEFARLNFPERSTVAAGDPAL